MLSTSIKHNSTIFKTITDDVTGATKSISIFNSTLSTMKRNIATGQEKIYTIFNGNKLTQNDIQSIIKYSQVLKTTGSTGEAWRSSMLNCSVAAKQYVLEAKKTGKTTEEMISGLKQVPKVSSIWRKSS